MCVRTVFHARLVGPFTMSHSKVPTIVKDPKWKIYEHAAAEWRDAPFRKTLALPNYRKPITMWGTSDQAMLVLIETAGAIPFELKATP